VFEIALFVVLIGAVGAALARRRARAARLPPPEDPRWGPRRKQIAGRRCVECGTKLIGEAEGDACEICGEIGHLDECLKRHMASAHGPEADKPYR